MPGHSSHVEGTSESGCACNLVRFHYILQIHCAHIERMFNVGIEIFVPIYVELYDMMIILCNFDLFVISSIALIQRCSMCFTSMEFNDLLKSLTC